MKKLFSLLVALLVLTGCPRSSLLDGSIAGSVIKGPVEGATVNVYPLTPNGRGASLVSGQTTSGGAFSSLSVGVEAGHMLVCASGGDFADEATGLTLSVGTNELCHVVALETGEQKTVVVDAWTTLATSLTECYVDLGATPTEGRDYAYGFINEYLQQAHEDISIGETVPFDPVGNLAPGLNPEVWSGLFSAALSQSAARFSDVSGLERGVNITPATLLATLVADVRHDCVFDGLDAGSQLMVGSVAINADALRGAPQGMLSSLADYLDRGRNSTGLFAQDVLEVSERMALYTSPIFGRIYSAPDFAGPQLVFEEPGAGGVLSGIATVRLVATEYGELASCHITRPAQLADQPADIAVDRKSCVIEAELNTTDLGDGPLELSAQAEDIHGNRTTLTIEAIVDNALPTVTVTNPQEGATVSGEVVIAATANDSAGIQALTVQAPEGLEDLLPAADELQAVWDTTSAAEGPFTIVVVATDESGIETTTEVNVVVDNLDVSTLSGVVDVGFPVAGAVVTAMAFNGLEQGDVLAEGETNIDGEFQLLLSEAPGGPVLLTASGGSYEDPATGELLTLTAQLRAALPSLAASSDVELSINPWTTLAVVHASAVGDTTDVLEESYDVISSHLSRPSALAIGELVSADLRLPAAPSAPASLLALANAGLSRMAADLATLQGAQPGTYSISDILTALTSDISDGVLNGQQGTQTVNLVPGMLADSYVLRTRFAAGVHNFVENRDLAGIQQPLNLSGIVSDSLLVADGFYDDITLNDDERLFPAGDAPLPFDDSAPSLTVGFSGIHTGFESGSSLDGNVQVLAEAVDDSSGILALRMIYPLEEDFPDQLAVETAYRTTFGDAVLPNFYVAANACEFDLNLPPLDTITEREAQVCACFEAEDTIGNVTRDMLCFTRPAPTVAFDSSSPEDGSLVAGEFRARAAASSGFQLASVEILGHEDVDSRLHVARAVIPRNFIDDENVPLIAITAEATDIAGRSTTSTITVGRKAPSAEIFAPAKSAQTSYFTYPMYWGGWVSSGYVFETCDWHFENAQTGEVYLSGAMDPSGGACIAQDYVEEEVLPDGTLRFVIEGTDIAGQYVTTDVTFTKNTEGVVASVLGPADELHTKADGGTFEFYGTILPAYPSTITLHLTRPDGSQTSFPVPQTNDDWLLQISSSLHLAQEGRYTYYLDVVAPSGVITTTSSRAFVVDRTAPDVVVQENATKLDERPEYGFTVTGSPTSSYFALSPPIDYVPYDLGSGPMFESWSTRTDWPRSTVFVDATDNSTQPESIEVFWRVVTGGCPSTMPASARPLDVNYAGQRSFVFRQSEMPGIDLASQDGSQDLRLCVWATDNAGNGAGSPAYQATFRWTSYPPPIYAEGGSSLYDETANALDFGYWQHDDSPIYYNTAAGEAFPSSSVCPASDWYCDDRVPRGYAVVDAVFVNPWDVPVEAKLNVAGTYSVRYTPQRHALRSPPLHAWWNDSAVDLRSPQASSSTIVSAPSRPIWDRDCIGKTPPGQPHKIFGNDTGDSQDIVCSVQPPEPEVANRVQPVYIEDGESFFDILEYEPRATAASVEAPTEVAYFQLAAGGQIALGPTGAPEMLQRNAEGYVTLPPHARVVALVMMRTPLSTQTDFFQPGADLTLYRQANCPIWMPLGLYPFDTDDIRYDKALDPQNYNGGCATYMFVQRQPGGGSPSQSSLLCGVNLSGESVNCFIDRTWWQADFLDVEKQSHLMWASTRSASAIASSWLDSSPLTDSKHRRHEDLYQ